MAPIRGPHAHTPLCSPCCSSPSHHQPPLRQAGAEGMKDEFPPPSTAMSYSAPGSSTAFGHLRRPPPRPGALGCSSAPCSCPSAAHARGQHASRTSCRHIPQSPEPRPRPTVFQLNASARQPCSCQPLPQATPRAPTPPLCSRSCPLPVSPLPRRSHQAGLSPIRHPCTVVEKPTRPNPASGDVRILCKKAIPSWRRTLHPPQ